MCSVPGLPLPGSEVPVLITRVNLKSSHGLVELWVNMDDGRKQINEQQKEEIQISQRKFCGSEGKPGDLCLVCIGDIWHRAQIVSIQSETYNVFLMDLGQPHVTTKEALAWGKSDSFLLPPEIELCILANVISLQNEWPETVTKFLMCLPGKKFKGRVQHVILPDRIILLEIPIVSKHMCKIGAAKKIKVDEFKEHVLKCLRAVRGESSDSFSLTLEPNLNVRGQLAQHDQYFYPELATDVFETVKVTAVNDPLNISCMLVVFAKTVKLLSEQIHQQYEESSDFGEAQSQICGAPCAARGTDGRWHRSLLKQNIVTGEGTVEVSHVDEGKTELVKAEDIRPLLGKFLKMPVVTYLCSLSGIKENGRVWTKDKTDDLKSMLLNQTMVARFDNYSKSQEVYYVSLYTANDECVNDIFLEKTSLTSSSEPEKDLNVQNESSSLPNSCEEKEFMDLHCTNKEPDDLLKRIWPNTESKVGDSHANDSPISGSKVSDHVLHKNGHVSKSLPSEVQNGCDHSLFAAGKTVDVKISCIESPQKFWCQATENSVSLRHLMQDLQNHTCACSQPLVESICVARNPDNKMWYRAKIIASHDCPAVHVRFIDYGQTQKVPLRDVCLINPAFLQLNAQAFQCCLVNLNNPNGPTPTGLTDVPLTEFLKLVDLGTSSHTGLKCVVKAITPGEDGLLLHMVDIQTESESLCQLLAQKCAQPKAEEQIPPEVPLDGYNYSTHNIEMGGEENVFVTSSETVSHFYCQLHRNSHVLDELMKNVGKLLDKPQSSDHPLKLGSICLARYTDDQWYRGQIVETAPKLKVHFVDYGDTLAVLEKEVNPFPPEAHIVRSVPMQAIPLGLFDVPVDLPQEVNQWFADLVVGHSFTISVVAKGEKGKLIVELFDGSLNVNLMVREKVEKIKLPMMTCMHTEQELNSLPAVLPTDNGSMQELKTDQQKETLSKDMHKDSPTLMEQVKSLDKGKLTSDEVMENKETTAETCIQSSNRNLEMMGLSSDSCQEGNGRIYSYRWPNISQNTAVEVYASCIVGPNYFWCQYTDTKDLNTVSKLAEEAGETQDAVHPETLEPGNPCLALFSSDNLWYRAQVIQKEEKTLQVLFVDYGNESEVDMNNVRSLPQSLLEMAPQAFLCCLSGFTETNGSWDDKVYDEFYNLLVNKPLTVTVLDLENSSEVPVPRYSVTTECDNVVVNKFMKKYWKSFSVEHSVNSVPQIESSPQSLQIESNVTDFDASKEKANTFKYKEPEICKCETEMVYASCIAEPSFFWCQFANTENIDKISRLAQEAGEAEQDIMFPQSLGPGSPCLTLFPSDNQWYRANVVSKGDKTLNVLFVDYGNESEVDVKNVKPLPKSLLDTPHQAFLCRLSGFDESKGSWDNDAYDEFYNLLHDKPLKLTVSGMEDHSETAFPQYSVKIEHEGVNINAAMLKYWKPVTDECTLKENPQSSSSIQDGQAQCDQTSLSMPEETLNNMTVFKDQMRVKGQTEMVYASCIAEPKFFWCQFANTEDLQKVSQLAREAGQAQQDLMFPQSLDPGSPCLALFSQDNQWYRAQVVRKDEKTLYVLFVDYGNEAEVDIQNVRPLPQSLLETPTQAFLCCLYGFDESKGSWEEEAYDYFYNLLVDKLLRLTVFNMEEHSETGVPQCGVEMECEGVSVKTLMEKYWRSLDTVGASTESLEPVDQDESPTTESSDV